jgi:nucleoside-diphosphate kinase
MEFEKERTLVIIKPDGIQRSLIGEIVGRIERTGLKFIAFKMAVPTRDQVIEHYHKDEAWFLKKGTRIVEDRTAHGQPIEKEAIDYGRDIIESNVKFMTSGPVLAFVVEGAQSVGIVKKLVGGTEPLTSDVGTIRGDLTVDSYAHSTLSNRAVRNLVHCSDSPEEAQREIGVWFVTGELVNYRLVQEQILYDVNIDGILE